MYELTRTLGYLAMPLSFSMALAIAAGVFAWRGRRVWAWRCGVAAVLWLWLASTPLTAALVAGQVVDSQLQRPVAEIPKADAIVILGGALANVLPDRKPSVVVTPIASRVQMASLLFDAGKAPLIVIAAGRPGGPAAGRTEAMAIADLLAAWQVPRAALRTEENSRTTRENARYSLSLLRAAGAKRVLLVTSTLHMRRALMTFEQEWAGQGIELIAAPASDFAPNPDVSLLAPLAYLPQSGALEIVTACTKELVGIALVGIMGLIHF